MRLVRRHAWVDSAIDGPVDFRLLNAALRVRADLMRRDKNSLQVLPHGIQTGFQGIERVFLHDH